MMWREEAGLVEMLLSYLGERQHFSGWANWRLLLVDILSCHEAAQLRDGDGDVRPDGQDEEEEELQQQKRSRPTSDEPCPAGARPMWPEADVDVDDDNDNDNDNDNADDDDEWLLTSRSAASEEEEEEAGGDVRVKVEAPEEEEAGRCPQDSPSTPPSASSDAVAVKEEEEEELGAFRYQSSSDTVKEENEEEAVEQAAAEEKKESACVPTPVHGWLQLPVATDGSQREEDEAAPTHASNEGRRAAKKRPRARRSGRRATWTDDCPASGTCEDTVDESCMDVETDGPSTSRSRETIAGARQTQRTVDAGEPIERLACSGTSAQDIEEGMDGSSSVHQGGSFPCSRCSKTFSDPGLRNTHERTHKRVLHKCSYCPKTFTIRSNKICHERKHTGEKPFKCSYCSKMFSIQGNLKAHERIHTGERPYHCSYCTKSFTHKGSQVAHERQHSGVKPYKCSYCDRMFTNVGNKNVHERIHSGVKPHNCSYCAATFINKSQLRIHELRHEERLKGKGYYTAYAYRGIATRIQAEPTPEKPYKCSFCSKTFAYKGHRTVHQQQRHGGIPVSYNFQGYPKWTPKIRSPIIGEKPFKCFFCPMTFREKYEKMMHERVHYEKKK